MNTKYKHFIGQRLIGCLAFFATLAVVSAGDWPMLGRDQTRNSASPETGAPIEWDVTTGRNIKWRAKLGGYGALSQPVVAGGLMWIATVNHESVDPAVETGDLGVLRCYRESDGNLLYQYVANSLRTPQRMSSLGLNCSPLVEGDRLWFTTHYGDVHCLDVEPLRTGSRFPRRVWHVDMINDFAVWPHYPFMEGGLTCSIGASYHNLIYVITGNGINWWRDTQYDKTVRSPHAPSLICFNKNTGKSVWQDSSPGTNILDGQWGSPLVIEVENRGQVIAPMGDGWVRSFDALTGRLLWKLDVNKKNTRQRERNHFLNAPVIHGGLVYIGGGSDLEQGEAPGRLFCIDPTKEGDLSLEITDGAGLVTPNPTSGVVWSLADIGRIRSLVAVRDGLVIAAEFAGFLHCLDARTGKRFWQHDMKGHSFGSPLIVDDKIYAGTEDGDFLVFKLAREKTILASQAFPSGVYGSPIFANGVLYVPTAEELFAIQQGANSPPTPK